MPSGIAVSDFYYILPELVLTVGALVVLIADVLLPRGSRALAWVTLAALGATLVALVPFSGTHVEVAGGLIAVDQFAFFFKLIKQGTPSMSGSASALGGFKAGLKAMGVIAHTTMYAPMSSFSEAEEAKVRAVMQEFGYV